MSILVSPLFIELATTTAQDQHAQQAEAQLEAALKKKVALLNMIKALETTLAAEPTVAHANMEGIIGQVVCKKYYNKRNKRRNPFSKKLSKK
jgi:hypothetical protein